MSQTDHPQPDFEAEVAAFIERHGMPSRVEVLLPDMNGRLRGKWIPGDNLAKLGKGALRLPWGTQALDIWGIDVPSLGVGPEVGDPDGICHPVPGTLGMADDHARSGTDGPIAQVLLTMTMPDATPCPLDPRTHLQNVLQRYASRGLTPVVAIELEFYLTALDSDDTPASGYPRIPGTSRDAAEPQVYDMDIVDAFAPVLEDITRACARLQIPADATIAEYGPGQFEINLLHCADAAKAGDQAILFKRVVRRSARAHGYHATFMAKPHTGQEGSGCHVHASVIDTDGDNIFAAPDASAPPKPRLLHAVAGCLETAPDILAILAPHLNSFRRFAPGSFAPVHLNWSRDHRGSAMRLPETTGPGARLEHRIAGADVNPYLLLASILAGMLHGMDQAQSPDAMVEPTATDLPGPRLTHDWLTAIEQFANSDFAEQTFGARYRSIYAGCRRAEHQRAAATVTDFEHQTYLPRL